MATQFIYRYFLILSLWFGPIQLWAQDTTTASQDTAFVPQDTILYYKAAIDKDTIMYREKVIKKIWRTHYFYIKVISQGCFHRESTSYEFSKAGKSLMLTYQKYDTFDSSKVVKRTIRKLNTMEYKALHDFLLKAIRLQTYDLCTTIDTFYITNKKQQLTFTDSNCNDILHRFKEIVGIED